MRELTTPERVERFERGHSQDVGDVRRALADGLVDRAMLRTLFDRIEPELFRYPAIDPKTFRRGLEDMLGAD